MTQTIVPPVPIFGTTRADNEAKNFFLALTRSPIAWGSFVSADLTATESDVRHGLGRLPNGYIVVSSSAAATVFNTTASTSTSLFLKASGAVSVKLWVF